MKELTSALVGEINLLPKCVRSPRSSPSRRSWTAIAAVVLAASAPAEYLSTHWR